MHSFLRSSQGYLVFFPIFGVWMVYVPVAASMYFQGNTFAAAGIMIFGVLILTIFVPFILQPYLGAKKSELALLLYFLDFFQARLFLEQGITSWTDIAGYYRNHYCRIHALQDFRA